MISIKAGNFPDAEQHLGIETQLRPFAGRVLKFSFRDRPDLSDGQSDAKTGMIQISLFLDPAQVAEIERAASSMVISAVLTTDLEAKPRKQS